MRCLANNNINAEYLLFSIKYMQPELRNINRDEFTFRLIR
jgi:hypothetical protein